MKISKKELIEMNACMGGLKRFIKQTNNTDKQVEVISLIGGENTTSDLLWLAGKTLSKDKIVKFACDCALINIELIKPYTDKYDLIVEFLNNPRATIATDDIATHAAAHAAAAHVDDAAVAVADTATHATYAATADTFTYVAYATHAAVVAAIAAAADDVNKLLVELFTSKD